MSGYAKSKYIIWSNEDIDPELNWTEELAEAYPDADDYTKFRVLEEINAEYLQDERHELNMPLGRPIIAIGDIGRWNGRKSGFKYIESGNIKDCLTSYCDYVTWYVDDLGDLRCDETHHDGTNHILYRVLKFGVSPMNMLQHKLFYQTPVTRADITRYTSRIGDRIAVLYGWRIRK